jgi:hypothetical protein
MPHVRRSHLAIWLIAAALGVLVLWGKAGAVTPAVLLGALGAHGAANVVFALRARRLRRASRAIPDLGSYQVSSPADLEHAFAQVETTQGLDLSVAVSGEARGVADLTAPLSGTECLGWSLRVELYRATALGGESDYSELLQTDDLGEIEIRDGSTSLVVRSPVVLMGEHRGEQMLSWKALNGRPAVLSLVDNAMQLGRLERRRFTGVRVEESVVLPGDAVTAAGRVRPLPEGLLMQGSGERDQPNPVFVFPRGARPGDTRAASVRPRSWIRLAASALLFAAGVASAAVLGSRGPWWRLEKAFPWANVERVGSLGFQGDPAGIAVHATTLEPDGPHSWTLDPDDWDVSLVSDETDALVRSSTRIRIERVSGTLFSVVPGHPDYPRWVEGGFRFVVPAAGSQPGDMPRRQGQFYVINRTSGDVEVRFSVSRKGTDLPGQYWSLEPEAANDEPGKRLVLDDQPFDLVEGDRVLVRHAGGDDAILLLGAHPDAAWDEGGTRWVLTVRSQTLSQRLGVLYVRNPNTHEVTLETGRMSFTLASGYGADSGRPLDDGGSPFVFREGDGLSVLPHRVDTLYEGALGSYPGAAWKDGAWIISPR